MLFFIAIPQAILHYLGLLFLFGGVLAVLLGNGERGLQIIITAAIFFALKYSLGAICLLFRPSKLSADVASSEERYESLVQTLNKIKHGTASTSTKMSISVQLINAAGLSDSDTQELIAEVAKVYSTEL